jgi:hypothetical protein
VRARTERKIFGLVKQCSAIRTVAEFDLNYSYFGCIKLLARLGAVLQQYVTHNRYYRSQKQFAAAILVFMREIIPQDWTIFRDEVSDNVRVITHENFRVLK